MYEPSTRLDGSDVVMSGVVTVVSEDPAASAIENAATKNNVNRTHTIFFGDCFPIHLPQTGLVGTIQENKALVI